MICPEGAIEIDYEPHSRLEIKRARTVFVKALDQAEAEGTFRRLVPVEKVDWETPFYKAFSEHPRWVIPKDDAEE
jgi:hypothetical protein